jgi:NAD(P)-dependent dehydrogenase (short-subunit alcohol dehydrogenase family)
MWLDGKRVVIVGGSSGIGLETARLALAEGAFVTIAGRAEDRLRRAAERLANSTRGDTGNASANRLRTAVADMTEESSIRALFAGETRVDHVFLPAGELSPGSADCLSADLESLRSILEVRLLGVACVVREARPRMEGAAVRSL